MRLRPAVESVDENEILPQVDLSVSGPTSLHAAVGDASRGCSQSHRSRPTPPAFLIASPAACSTVGRPTAGPSNPRKRIRDPKDDDDVDIPLPNKRCRERSLAGNSCPSPTSEQSSPPPMDFIDVMFHSRCRKSGRACIDPTVGCILPLQLAKDDRYVVYNDEQCSFRQKKCKTL
jgi:hypothetical protein